MAVFF